MTPGERDQYENEQNLGNKAQHSYNQFIKGFVNDKRKSLFEAFRILPVTDNDKLMEIKRMLFAVDTLEQEILTVIETGKLASKSLTDSEEE